VPIFSPPCRETPYIPNGAFNDDIRLGLAYKAWHWSLKNKRNALLNIAKKPVRAKKAWRKIGAKRKCG
jgi:hypothetical protein